MKTYPDPCDPCDRCGVAIRRWDEKAAQRPGTRGYGGNGLCDTCWKRDRRSSNRRPAYRTAEYLHPGNPVELVSWTHTVDGAQPTLVTGTYKGRTREAWFVEIDGITHELPRERWEDCVA